MPQRPKSSHPKSSRAHKLRAHVMRYRNRLERCFNALSPTLYLGSLLRDRRQPLDWFAAENCVPVEHMTGYRMTFRTAVIRRHASSRSGSEAQ